ncbi:hypothetical protein H7F15_11985 [Pontibacter sp. Tf4]|uniref:hypothetical protein n=1 Tax=Pontibacter sp. Tf4 TaxID=2761620 RepID=UPI001629A39F|nr:hypothetical protein [Pontibacter sp. Tf4]MBB6611761.1 hypothetical protein [Pontibacter sp. Tf4]
MYAEILLDSYHLAIISKPFVPLIKKTAELRRDIAYINPQTGGFPSKYIERDQLEYYAGRNKEVIKLL